MVTVLLLGLVIRIEEKVASGAWLVDQFAAVRHSPLIELVHWSETASALLAKPREVEMKIRMSPGRLLRTRIICTWILAQNGPRKRVERVRKITCFKLAE